MKWLRQFRYYRQQGWGIFSAVRLTNWGIVYYQGVYSERERIIKLLESNNKLCTEKTVCIEANEGYPCLCTDLIALIKGEQK